MIESVSFITVDEVTISSLLLRLKALSPAK
jgi:hypothetical protein